MSIRWSSLPTATTIGGNNFRLGAMMESGTATACHSVGEFVLDPTSGTFASLQEPPAFASLLNGNNSGACSFVLN
jgi:hypothetical protein